MKIKRILQGVCLSFVFILFSGCAIYGVNACFSTLTSGINASGILLADISGVQNNDIFKTENSAQNLEIKPPEINAESAISVKTDFSGEQKTIFEKNADTKLPIASLTKLMTAIVSLENYDLLKKITVSKKADLQDPMLIDLKQGDIFLTIDFLHIMLVESSNKAAYALAEQMGEKNFIALMNQKALEIGLKNTFFEDATGLSEKNISTAKDLAKLAEYIIKNYPEIAEITRTKSFDLPNLGKIENTNDLLAEIPNIVGGKTGFTRMAKGCMLLIMDDLSGDEYFIHIILGADDRFLEAKKLIDFTK
jgi:D-alanyl-D-alanine carboxypeptidase